MIYSAMHCGDKYQ